MNLLIIEDDEEVINTFVFSLENHFNIFIAKNVEDAIDIISNHKLDIITLDRSLNSNDDGLYVAKYIKDNFFAFENPPHLIIISSKTNEEEIDIGFSLHADYYITKPINMLRLVQIYENIKSRRLASLNNDEVYSYKNIAIRKSQVFIDGKNKKISQKKLSMLKILIKNSGKIISRDYLLDILYAHKAHKVSDPRIIDVYIYQLKRELALESNLKTIYKKGYLLEELK